MQSVQQSSFTPKDAYYKYPPAHLVQTFSLQEIQFDPNLSLQLPHTGGSIFLINIF